jgi:hypothetical protein
VLVQKIVDAFKSDPDLKGNGPNLNSKLDDIKTLIEGWITPDLSPIRTAVTGVDGKVDDLVNTLNDITTRQQELKNAIAAIGVVSGVTPDLSLIEARFDALANDLNSLIGGTSPTIDLSPVTDQLNDYGNVLDRIKQLGEDLQAHGAQKSDLEPLKNDIQEALRRMDNVATHEDVGQLITVLEGFRKKLDRLERAMGTQENFPWAAWLCFGLAAADLVGFAKVLYRHTSIHAGIAWGAGAFGAVVLLMFLYHIAFWRRESR